MPSSSLMASPSNPRSSFLDSVSGISLAALLAACERLRPLWSAALRAALVHSSYLGVYARGGQVLSAQVVAHIPEDFVERIEAAI